MAVPWPERPLLGIFHVPQARALIAAGHGATLFGPAPFVPAPIGACSARLAAHRSRPRRYHVDGVEVLSPRVPFAFPPVMRETAARWSPSWVCRAAAWAMRRELDAAIAAARPTALLAHGMIPWSKLILAAGRRHGLPVAFIEHSATDVLRIEAGSRLARYYARVAAEAQNVFLVGPQLVEHAQRLGWKRAELLINGITPQPEPEPSRWGPGRHILVAANYYPRKGIETVVEAFGKACHGPAWSDVHLHVVTAPPSELRTRIARSPVVERVHVHSPQSPDVLRRMMAWSDLFVLPSAAEAFGLVYGEAMAAGTPIVLSKDSGFARVLRARHERPGEVARFVPAMDTGSLASCLREILADPDWLTRAGRAASRFPREHLSWSANVRQLVAGLSG